MAESGRDGTQGLSSGGPSGDGKAGGLRGAIPALLGAAAICVSGGANAMTLGRIQGAALIGKPLDVTIQVTAEAGESLAASCFEVDVFHGDARQDGSRVRIALDPAAAGAVTRLRVSSSTPVDEPVVTVYVRSSCAGQLSRRYVMLADILTEQASPAPVVVPPVSGGVVTPSVVGTPVPPMPGTQAEVAGGGTAAASPASAATPSPAPAATTRPSAASTPAPAATRPTRPAARPPARPAAPRPDRPAAAAPRPAASVPASPSAAAAAKPPAPPAGNAARLRLEQIDVLNERIATLESAAANQPAEVAARQARDAARIEAMETNVKSLLALASRNEANLTQLRTRLEQAESERYANPLVYALAFLLLLCVLGFAWLLRRSSAAPVAAPGGNWWGHATGAGAVQGPTKPAPAEAQRNSGFATLSSPAPLSSPGQLTEADPFEKTARVAPPRSVAAPITQVDVSLVEMSESTFDRLMQSGATHSAVRKSRAEEQTQAIEVAPQGPRSRSINSEELFDIRQQAEFFVSLGQTDQAVRILENRISQSGESSPLAYLDLLKIFHSLGLKADYRQVREDFDLLFNASVPDFAAFHDEGRELEGYPAVLDGIMSDWGTPAVFSTIENYLFRDPANANLEPFDLAAFRDLLLLHAVAQWVMSASESLPAPAGASIPSASVPAGLGAATVPGMAAYTTQSTMRTATMERGEADEPLPTIAAGNDVDIDLSDIYDSMDATSVITPAVPSNMAPVDGDSKPASVNDNLIDFDLSGYGIGKKPGEPGPSKG